MAQVADYSPLFTDNNFSKTINVSLPVGRTPGKADVVSGSGHYTIPIVIPPGTDDVVPQISLAYNSLGGYSIAGVGWSIAGLSTITRANQTMYHDQKASGVTLNTNEHFALDGIRLVLQSGTSGANGSVYKPDREDFSKVELFKSGLTSWFIVTTKDGVEMEYGNTTDSKLRGNQFFVDDIFLGDYTLFWKINKIKYPGGNYIEFKYDNTNQECRISEIKYTGNVAAGIDPYNRIRFAYGSRTDTNIDYVGGASVGQSYLLDSVVVETGIKQADGKRLYSTVREYKLKYGTDNVNSYLKEIIESGSDDSKLNSTIFKYGQQPTVQMSSISSSVTLNSEGDNYIGDFDGDGKDDILHAPTSYFQSNKFNKEFKIYKQDNLSAEGVYKLVGSQTLPQNSVLVNPARNPARRTSFFTNDFTGDGIDDIFTFNSVNETMGAVNKLIVYKSVKNPDWATDGTNMPILFETKELPAISGYTKLHASGNSINAGDLNGDGVHDVLAFLGNSSNAYKAFLYLGNASTSFTEVTISGTYQLNVPNWPEADQVHFLDFNGDGKDDMMLIKDNHCEIFTFENAAAKRIFYSTTLLSKDHVLFFGDFNGDKKTDLLFKAPSGDWTKAFSSGKNFRPFQFTFEDAVDIDEPAVDQLVLGDYNGDGRTDIFHGWQLDSRTDSRFNLYYSTGLGFKYSSIPNTNPVDGEPFFAGDLNGDGRADLINRYDVDQPLDFYYFGKNGKEMLLEKAIDGMGVTTEWVHTRLTESGPHYSLGETTTYPLYTIQAPTPVVTELKVSNGLGGFFSTTYAYEGARINVTGKGFLGFAKTTVSDYKTGIKTVTDNEFNRVYYAAAPQKVENYLIGSSTRISQTLYSNTFVDAQNSKRFWLKVTDVYETKDLEGGRINTVTNIFDDFGNITKSTVNKNNVETSITDTEYEAFVSGIKNKPTLVTTNVTRSGEPSTFGKATKFEYTTGGELFKQTEFNNTNKKVVTEYVYFPAGTVDKVTVTGYDGATALTARSKSFIYDNEHRYPLTIKNELLQELKTTYDPRWGVPLTEKGVDGLTVSYQYDAFGRRTITTPPTVTPDQSYNVVQSYGWGQSGQPLWYSNVVHPGKPDVKTWYDLLEREVKKETQGFSSANIVQTKTYDAKGNLHIEGQPYQTGETPLTAIHLYDQYNRIASINKGVLGTTSYAYEYSSGNLKTTITEPRGISSQITDATGAIIKATDPNSKSLDYTYYAHGGLKDVKGENVTLVHNEYDANGRQNKLVDANAGTITYNYNAYGELVSQTNANGETYTMEYDVLGRITKRSRAGEPSTTYKYFTQGTGINQIEKVTDFNANSEDYLYDGYGRLASITENIDGANKTSFLYNKYGDLTTKTFPSGFGIVQGYDANGYLTNITTKDSKLLYTTVTMNGQGQVKDYTLASNSQPGKITYTNGFPTKYESDSKQNLSFTWDYAKGSLISRSDLRKSMSESFIYDNLLRLEKSTIGSTTLLMTYFPNGNIEKKPGVGTYSYHPTKIHAVAGITNMPSGAAVPSTMQNITYTAFNQPEKLTEGTFELTYTYGADYQRRKSILKENGNTVINTRYYLDGYEKELISGSPRYIQYVYAPIGLVSIVVTDGSTHTPYFVYSDYLGSILTVTRDNGTIEAEQSFDAWGRRRDPSSWDDLLDPNSTPSGIPNWLYRGYTEHEQLDKFGLINMNGRMYDPVLGRMLSADNNVPDDKSLQGFNRYAYAFNNPLLYTDPDGELAVIIPYIVAGVIGGASNLAANWDKVKGIGSGLAYFGNGAVGGAMSVMNPIAGAAATSAMNVGTDMITGNLPKFNDGYDVAAYTFSQVNSAMAAAASGKVAEKVINKALQIASKAPWGYRWARTGGGDLVDATTGKVIATETNARVLIEDVRVTAQTAASSNPIALEGAVKSNFARFVSKMPANSRTSATAQLLPDGNYLFEAVSPGRVPGSSAVYQKWVTPTGETFKMLKTTYAPDGTIVHIKPK